jgi:hypothetical protein
MKLRLDMLADDVEELKTMRSDISILFLTTLQMCTSC